ncbi:MULTISPECIES: hypothetical protein [Bacillus]|uniref:Uncharacterized protein n=2 Tax=Bacillus thuringiensis TaxID=1428 RepID=A0AAP4V231_BACTU|nr:MULTISPECIES: hypothetical protein [Bacillus]MEC0046321.1 hypothetical protein [Bacillus cereus]AFV21685.1 hypothetical protein BTB_502p03800 [Bacillus thuringiensis Bt407]EEM25286.1 hypothetical protein bthur0002_59280 [Bacillus thuringiensis Bt407]ERI01139.1 hypothetical protein BTCBT_002694 [Bacillus thuringiensis T01-328]MBN6707893.1 hypothetical protein [Bacillus thuringiensis]
MIAEILMVFGLIVGLIIAISRLSPIIGIIFLIMLLIGIVVFSHYIRKEELTELKEVIAHNLSISQKEILFDVERTRKSFLGWRKLYVFTSKGEFEVNIHRDNGEWVGIDLISISNVDYMKELNY